MLWNEGKLPEDITIESLNGIHPSRPRNELIAGTFFNAGLIEAWGQGTINIVNACKEHNLPEPDFREAFGGFELTMLKDIYTEEYLRKLGLNERQVKAVLYIKEKGKITNAEYQKLNDVSTSTATRDLTEMIRKNMIVNIGGETKSAVYKLVN